MTAPGIRWLLAFALFAGAHHRAFAAGDASFLKLPVQARSLGLGYGAAASAAGSEAMSDNPAGLARLDESEAGLLYAPHLQGMRLGWLAYARPTRLGAFGAGLLSLRSGPLEGRDDAGNRTGDFSAEDRAMLLSFARGAGVRGLRVGGTLKVVQSRVQAYGASTLAGDVGIQAPARALGRTASLGFAVRNLGPGLRWLERRQALPTDATVAATSRVSPAFLFAAGVRHRIAERRTEFQAGTEVTPLGSVALRASYGIAREPGAGGGLRSLVAFGIGIERGGLRLDYGMQPDGGAGATQRFGLTLRFGEASSLPSSRGGAGAGP
ncbi:MAG: PorV/PorQ family protein [Elusimicrobia bacterium]|nr:PorV/PorQ family protein [Elusimicrobiota bacterium]